MSKEAFVDPFATFDVKKQSKSDEVSLTTEKMQLSTIAKTQDSNIK